MELNLETITRKMRDAAKTTGQFLYSESKNFDRSKIEHKGAFDLVSYADKTSEKQLVSALADILPEAGFITEESTVKQEEKDLQWVIDPLDGTTNFLHGLPAFTISIALLKNKEPVAGVVYEPNLDECFYAWKNGGAWKNQERISVSPVSELKESLVASGFPYSQLDKSDNHFKILQELQDQTHGIRRFGSAALDLSYVACGRFDAYYEFNLKIWDIAAGILIVQEAGGQVCDFSGRTDYLHGKELLAAGPVKVKILEVIQRFWNQKENIQG